MMNVNIPSDTLQRVGIRIITEMVDDGEPIYVSYDLGSEFCFLKKYLLSEFIGFAIEESYFAAGTYDESKLGPNEFRALREYYIGTETQDSFVICGRSFSKESYMKVVPNIGILRAKLADVILSVNEADSLTVIADLYRVEENFQKEKVG